MNGTIGMLWCDFQQNKSLTCKIDEAVRYYETKYGDRPNLVYVNSADFPIQTERIYPGVEVLVDSRVQKYHMWIGRKRADEH